MYNILQAEEILQELFKFEFFNISDVRKFACNKHNKGIKKLLDERYPNFFLRMSEIRYLLIIKDIDKILKEKFCYCGQLKNNFDGHKYLKFCSLKCSANHKNTREKTKQTNIKRFGVDTPAKAKEVQQKMKQTCLERYGDENYNNNKQASQTCLERYGVTNPNQVEEFKLKKALTYQKRYGVNHNSQIDSVKESKKLHFLEKFQATSPLGNKDIQIKIKQVINEKYGCDYPMQSDEIKKTRAKNYKSKHGVDHQTQRHLQNLDDLNEKFIRDNFIENDMFKIDEFCDYFNYSKSHSHKIRQIFNIEELAPANTCKTQFSISEWLKSYNLIVKDNDRQILNGKELDIYLPDHNLAIEYDGLMYHSFGKDSWSVLDNYETESENKDNHLIKTEECAKQGIELLHIFENEWVDPIKQNIWKSIILSKLNLNEKINIDDYAIKEISIRDSNEFLELNHLEGSYESDIQIGLFIDNELISLMTFNKNLNNRQYSLIRYCNKLKVQINNSFSILLDYFIDFYKPSNIIASINRRFDNIELYQHHNFQIIHITKPKIFYFKPSEYHLYPEIIFEPYLFKEELEYFDNNKNLSENLYNNGYRKIYDCGDYIVKLII